MDWYIDVVGGFFVKGTADGTRMPVPAFIQGDTPSVRIWLLNRSPSYPAGAPFSLIGTDALTLEVAIGRKIGNATTYYTQQFAWTADPSGLFWTASLPMNTAEITALIGANQSATAWLEVKVLDAATGGLPRTVLQLAVTIQAAVIKDGAVVVLPGLTPLYAEQAGQLYLTRVITGAITLVNANTGKKVALYVDDDGQLKGDAVQ